MDGVAEIEIQIGVSAKTVRPAQQHTDTNC